MITLNDIPDIAVRTAQTLGRTLNAYWPADQFGNNDPDEKLLSFHFGHVLMNDGFAVFPEADHPDPACQGVDLLAISESLDCFIACEFKRYVNNAMANSLKDLDRVATFRLNTGLNPARVGKEPLVVLEKCEVGLGIVAGINWASGKRKGEFANTAKQIRFAERVSALGGAIAAPELVRRYDTEAASGAYYLYYAYLPVWRRDYV